MPLDPLGFKNPLLPQQTLGHKFQPLQPASPLGQSLAELGENLQATEFSLPLVQTEPELQPVVQQSLEGRSPLTFPQSVPTPPQIDSEPIPIQARSDNQSLPVLKTLGQSSPLTQKLDFQVSELVAEFSSQSASNSQEIPRIPENSIIERSQLPSKIPAPEPSTHNIGYLPDSWSSISELLDATSSNATENLPSLNSRGFTQPLNRALDFRLATTDEKPQAVEFDQQPIKPKLHSQASAWEREQNPKSFGDIPNSWSSLSELLGENSTSTPNISKLPEDEFASVSLIAPQSLRGEVTPSLSLYGRGHPAPTSGDLTATSQQLTADVTSGDSAVDDQQLEILAQQVYHLLRQRVEIEQQRWGNKCMGYPLWVTDRGSAKLDSAFHKVNSEIGTAGTVEDISEVSPLDNQLQILTQEVYMLTRQRLEIEQERQGRYYPGCFPC